MLSPKERKHQNPGIQTYHTLSLCPGQSWADRPTSPMREIITGSGGTMTTVLPSSCEQFSQVRLHRVTPTWSKLPLNLKMGHPTRCFKDTVTLYKNRKGQTAHRDSQWPRARFVPQSQSPQPFFRVAIGQYHPTWRLIIPFLSSKEALKHTGGGVCW